MQETSKTQATSRAILHTQFVRSADVTQKSLPMENYNAESQVITAVTIKSMGLPGFTVV
jgi:hypothetical protein